jgi:hypothetical protein
MNPFVKTLFSRATVGYVRRQAAAVIAVCGGTPGRERPHPFRWTDVLFDVTHATKIKEQFVRAVVRAVSHVVTTTQREGPMSFRFRYVAFVLLGFSLNAGGAFAQTPPAEEPPAAAPPEAAPPAAEPPPPAHPVVVAEVVAPPPAPAPSGFTPFKILGSNGSSIRLGVLFQPQYQAVNSAESALTGYSQNLYIRRTRILVGGTLFGNIEYFLDTDYPNLFLGNAVAGNAMAMPPTAATTAKATPGMNIQDAFVTYKPMGDVFKVDAGYMLPPMAHNALQGAGTLYSWDYYSYTFQHNNVFGASATPVGRDLGVQVRGLVVDGHLEYRAGLFQGLRDGATATQVGSRNFFRATARVQINFLDAEPGFFYAGTYLGAKKILSVGGSVDIQDKYKYFGGDAFLDMPAGPGVATAQVNVSHWDGDGFVELAKQTAIMGEAGYNIAGVQINPIARAEHLSGTGLATATRYGGGLAYWAYGHNSNVKLFVMRIDTTGAGRVVNQLNLQWQVYLF